MKPVHLYRHHHHLKNASLDYLVETKHLSRKLTFNVEYESRLIRISLPDTDTVGKYHNDVFVLKFENTFDLNVITFIAEIKKLKKLLLLNALSS